MGYKTSRWVMLWRWSAWGCSRLGVFQRDWFLRRRRWMAWELFSSSSRYHGHSSTQASTATILIMDARVNPFHHHKYNLIQMPNMILFQTHRWYSSGTHSWRRQTASTHCLPHLCLPSSTTCQQNGPGLPSPQWRQLRRLWRKNCTPKHRHFSLAVHNSQPPTLLPCPHSCYYYFTVQQRYFIARNHATHSPTTSIQ